MKHPEQIYLAGYEAFQEGDFDRAIELAETCLGLASSDSYWYAGALGLKCWAANFAGNPSLVEQFAGNLLSLETGDDKPWFDGLACFNLGLAMMQSMRSNEARAHFERAARCYASQCVHPGQPDEWQSVLDYFSTLAKWCANGRTAEWWDFLSGLQGTACTPSDLLEQLSAAAKIMLRYSQGEDVKKEAMTLVEGGVSRTFLSPVLLGCAMED